MNPTDEQIAIADAFATGDPLVIEAGAGTGKTSTLRMLASEAPDRSGLYIAYNRAIADDAGQSFPLTVRCSTAHALAYRAIGYQFKDRLNGPRMPAWKVADALELRHYERLSNALPISSSHVARIVMETVDKFCYSADEEPDVWHLPYVEGLDMTGVQELRQVVVPLAREAWKDLQRPHGKLKFTHDCYLKLWALSRPQLDYDYVMLDEAQDANPLIAQIVEIQPSQRVLVGDRCQAIYQWRGAVDAMRKFEGRRLMLSQSFRFGPSIAENANEWLDILDTPLRLRGWTIDSSVGPADAPDAILCRTNAQTVGELIASQARGRKAALQGTGPTVKRLAEAANELRSGKRTSHPELFLFESWDQLEDYVKNDKSGQDLKAFVGLINKFGADQVIRAIDRSARLEDAEVIISTAHKAKGLEWPTVKIAEDFQVPIQQERKEGEEPAEPVTPTAEAMLAYVAVTRAKRVLDRGPLTWAPMFKRGG